MPKTNIENISNPFCDHCKEEDCCVSLDGTCSMIRVYLNNKFIKQTLKETVDAYDSGNSLSMVGAINVCRVAINQMIL